MPLTKKTIEQNIEPVEKDNTSVPITLTVTFEFYDLTEKVKRKSGARTPQEAIRNMMNFYFIAHGYKIA
jgi:hypothetical protein